MDIFFYFSQMKKINTFHHILCVCLPGYECVFNNSLIPIMISDAIGLLLLVLLHNMNDSNNKRYKQEKEDFEK